MLGWMNGLFLIFLAFSPDGLVSAASKEELQAKLEQARRLSLDDPRASIAVSRELLTTINAKQDPELWLQAALLAAGSLRNTSKPLEFEKLVAEAIPLAKTLPDTAILSDFMVLQALAIRSSGRNQEAADLLTKIIPIAAKSKKRITEVRAHSMLGETLARLGQPSAASEHLNQAYDILKDCPKEQRYYTEMMNIAAIFMTIDENQTGRIIEMLEPVAQFAIKENLRFLAQFASHNLATNLEAEEKYDKALFYYHEEERIAKELNDENGLALASYGIGCVLIFLDRLTEAQDYLRKSLKIFESKNHENIIYVNMSLLEIALQQKNTQDSEKLIRVIEADETHNKADNFKRSLLQAKAQVYELKRDWVATAGVYKELVSFYVKFMKDRDQELTNKYNAMFDLKRREKDNQDLSLQNSLQAERLAASEKFRVISIIVLGLSLGLVAFLLIVLRQSKEIKISRIHMKRILDNVAEAIIILDPKLMIKIGYSEQLEQIIGQNKTQLKKQNLMEFLFQGSQLSEDSISIIRSTLDACFGETALAWELNSAQLPYELVHGKRTLGLHWQPLLNKDGLIHELLVSIRDITEEKKMQHVIEMETAKVGRMQNLLMEMFSRNYAAANRFLAETQATLITCESALFEASDLSLAFRTLHTIKGNARSLGLKTLATAVHDMEATIVIAEHRLLDEATARLRWSTLMERFHDYRSLVSMDNAQGLSENESGPKSLYQNAPVYLAEATRRLEGLALAGVFVNDKIQNWNPEALTIIHNLLLHALTNSIDHGFLLASPDRLRPARIEIDAQRDSDTVYLKFSDNGAGLNLVKLEARAKSLGFVPQNGETLADVVFCEGVSTADTTSETSGRGIGMSAIKAGCLDLGGHIAIRNRPEGGTLLTMRLPAHRVCLTPAAEGFLSKTG